MKDGIYITLQENMEESVEESRTSAMTAMSHKPGSFMSDALTEKTKTMQNEPAYKEAVAMQCRVWMMTCCQGLNVSAEASEVRLAG